MAELQSYPGKYPDWKTNVVLIAASIDESADVASKHLKAKGWNETHNVWVDIHAIRAYHVDTIPTVYVIGRLGRIIAVNPGDLSQVVNRDLKEDRAAEERQRRTADNSAKGCVPTQKRQRNAPLFLN